MDNNTKLTTLIGIVFACLIVSTPQIFALGISAPYWKTNPLKMYPGQTKDISFALLNSNKETEKAYITLIEGSEIASITTGESYTILPQTKNILGLKIKIPQDAPLGTTYNIILSVKSIPPTKEGTIQLGIGYKVDFPIFVTSQSNISKEPEPFSVPRPKEKNFNWKIALALISIIIIATIIALALIRKRK